MEWLIIKQTNPLVTVVITTYNSGHYLKEAIESVLDQTFQNWKMIIIDDASTDNSVESIESFIEDERIQLIQNNENIGQTKCLNLALDHVTTPFMVQLDSDDWFNSNTLEVLVQKARDLDENWGVISGNIKILWHDESGKETKSIVKKGKNFSDPNIFMLSKQSCWPRFYPTEALKSLGGWPTDGPYEGRYIEDLRMLYRLIYKKYQFVWIDQTLYNHRRHNHNMTNEIPELQTTLQWLISRTLEEWGDYFIPRFKPRKDGKVELIALSPKTQSGVLLKTPKQIKFYKKKNKIAF